MRQSAAKIVKLCGEIAAKFPSKCGDCAAFKANFLGPIGFSFVMMMWRIDLYDSCSMMQNIAVHKSC